LSELDITGYSHQLSALHRADSWVQQPATCLQADSWAGLQGDARMRAQATRP